MSFVTTQPEMLVAAAGNLQGIGSERWLPRTPPRPQPLAWYPLPPTSIGADSDTLRRARHHASDDQRPGHRNPRIVRRHPGHQRRIVCGHRGRQRDRGRLTI